MSSLNPVATVDLRSELKAWEQAFATKYGRKPTREDIKHDGTIAEKYRQFNRSRRSQNGTNDLPATPKKSNKNTLIEKSVNIKACPRSTPRKELSLNEQEPPMPTPSHIRFALGPTPQKDGHVLGLFDAILDISAPQDTTQASIDDAVVATPGRITSCSSDARYSRTPQSSGKRYFLDAFAGTPLKRKRCTDDTGTPTSIKRTYDTPAFLRRDRALEADSQDDTGVPGKKKKGLVRSLSTIIADLRKNEDERMDEEWQIMRDMEGNCGSSSPVDGEHVFTNQSIQMADLQGVDMPLGPDRSIEEQESEAEYTSVRKPWKKKGLKRQTKKVNMKPVLHAPGKSADLADGLAENGTSSNETTTKDGANPVSTETGLLKKVVRKVNEAAHMNFRRLKIKNKNSKASGRGRFRR